MTSPSKPLTPSPEPSPEMMGRAARFLPAGTPAGILALALAFSEVAREARDAERERCAGIAESVRGGFTANICIDESEPELLPDPDGPWVLNADVAKAIRAPKPEEQTEEEKP